MHVLFTAIAEIQQNAYYNSFNSKVMQPGITIVLKLVSTTHFNTVWILTSRTVFLLSRDSIQILAVSITSREYKCSLYPSTHYREGTRQATFFQSATYKLRYKDIFKTTWLETWENLDIVIIVNALQWRMIVA